MTDWLAACRAAADDVRAVLAELPGRAEREPVVGAGLGGDDTTAVDAAAERVVVDRLAATGAAYTLARRRRRTCSARRGSRTSSPLRAAAR